MFQNVMYIATLFIMNPARIVANVDVSITAVSIAVRMNTPEMRLNRENEFASNR